MSATPGRAPYGIVKHRSPAGTIRHSDRIDRFWKSKKDGTCVMVMQFQHVANENKKRVVFVNEADPTRQVSCDYSEFIRDFERGGNLSSKF